MTSPPLLTPADVASRLAVRVETARALIASGRIKSSNISPSKRRPTYRVRPEDLEAFIAGAQVLPPLPKARRKKREPTRRTFFPEYTE